MRPSIPMKKAIRAFKALGDETRLRVVNLLLDGDLCVSNFSDILEIDQPKVSRHLAYLKNTGLITDERKGLWVCYSLSDDEFFSPLINCLKRYREEIEQLGIDTKRLAERGVYKC